MFYDLLDACRRNDFERVRPLVAADPTLMMRQASTGDTPLLSARRAGNGETTSRRAGQLWPRNACVVATVDDVVSRAPCRLLGARHTAELPLAYGADHRLLSRNHMANIPPVIAVIAHYQSFPVPQPNPLQSRGMM